ncbi:MAG: GNAT family N-acetyltransferase [Bacteroidota bacterium]
MNQKTGVLKIKETVTVIPLSKLEDLQHDKRISYQRVSLQHRISKELMKFIMSFEFMTGLRRIVLATRDAHGLYEQFGFQLLQRPDRWMEIHHPDVYEVKS